MAKSPKKPKPGHGTPSKPNPMPTDYRKEAIEDSKRASRDPKEK